MSALYVVKLCPKDAVTYCKAMLSFSTFLLQIAAKIGGDGVAAPSSNEFGYGGQKRPLEDAGGYFPMPNLIIGQCTDSYLHGCVGNP